jgi:hypothetical protein
MALVKYNNNSLSSVTSAASVSSGAMTLIKTITADSASTVSFINGSSDVVFDSTYPIYVFKFINIHPASNDYDFKFNLSADTGSNYNVTKTDNVFRAYHKEDDSAASIDYQTSLDLVQSTNFAFLSSGQGNGDDESLSGELFLFNPSSTTFVKHYLTHTISYHTSNFPIDFYGGGYGNTTSAVDAVQFKMSSGNIDSGTIKLYGIKDS